ncbi:DUF6049 family protein [Pengzhenrongella sp.]|jgi:hypothetical protein|uniref:DUF6049 family protein n=1 Tax=Pengzhenrongella sp. TaxID=2888820 RepID=UPI002F943852
MSARLRRARSARPGPLLRGLLGAVLAVGVLLEPALVGALPAGASTPTPSASDPASPSPTPTTSADSSGDALPVDVSITSVSPQVLRPGDELVVRATVRNTGDTALANPRAALRIRRFLISTRSAVDQWAQADPTDYAGTSVRSAPLSKPLAPGATANIQLKVPANELLLSTAPAAWGPRGISVELTDAGRRAGLARTFTLWLPTPQLSTVRVSVAVPLTGDPLTPDAATHPVVPSKAELARLRDMLTVTKDRPAVAWVVDPALLGALAADDTAAAGGADQTTPAAQARVLAARLATAAAGRDIFALPWLDPDLAALAHAGAADTAASATRLSRRGSLPVLGTPPRTDLAWPAQSVPDQATVALAAKAGARNVVVGGDGLASPDLSYTPTGRATVKTPSGDVGALVADPALTAQLFDAGPATAATAAQRMLAETAVVARERPNDARHLLLAPGRSWRPDVAIARAQLGTIAGAPWVHLSPVSTLIGTADPGVERDALPTKVVAAREVAPAQIQTLRTARAALDRFATLVHDPATLLTGADATELAPLSVAWRAEPARRTAAVHDAEAALTARRSGVSVVPGSLLKIISQSGTFPVRLRNDLNQDVTVQVALDPENRRLVVDGAKSVVVPANSQTQARIPFKAVGSGDVKVNVALLAPDGSPIADATPFVVRVRADWENVGTVIVAGILGLAFLFGIVRTIRRGQTTRRGASEQELAVIAVSDVAPIPVSEGPALTAPTMTVPEPPKVDQR